MAKSAVIKTGGKQYIVTPGQKLKIEKLDTDQGKEVVFKDVLLVENDGNVQIGSPTVAGASVKGTVAEHGKGKKVVVFKFKAKKRQRTKNGHRQPYTEVEITNIESK